jgi:hypothetical protein
MGHTAAPYEHAEWALQRVTATSTADSTTHRAVSWGPYRGPRAVVAPESRVYVTFWEPRNGYTDDTDGTVDGRRYGKPYGRR